MGWDFLKLERLKVIIFGLGVFLYLLLIFQKSSWQGDEGMVLSSALRVVQGQLMYRDFFEFWTPGIVYLGAAIIKFIGLNLLFFRAFALLNLLSVLVLIFFLTQELIPQRSFFVFLPSLYFLLALSQSMFIFYHQWISLALVGIFAFVCLKARAGPIKFFCLGVLAGLSFLFTQTQGVATNLAFILTLWFSSQSRPIKFRELGIFVLGELSVILPVFVYFSLQAGAATFFYDIVGFILSTYSEHYKQVNPSFIWPVVLIFYLWFALNFRRALRESEKLRLVFFLGLSLLLVYIRAPIRSHTYLSFIGAAPLIFYALKNVWPKIKSLSQPLSQITLWERSQTLLTVFLFYLLFFDVAFFAVPDQIDRWLELNFPIQSRAGTLYTTEWQADRTNYIIDFLNQNTSPGEYIYVGPYSSQFYVLANIKNPTRYSQLTPKYNPNWMFEDAVSDLKSKNPRFIILLTSETPFKFEEDNPLSLFVLENYVVLKKLPQGAAYRPTNRPENAIFVRKDLAGEFGVDESQNIVQ